MATLILVRHGKSEWNKLGLWTGHVDVDLAHEGHEEAERAGTFICDIDIHHVHVSLLRRTHQTLEGVRRGHGRLDAVAESHAALNERHYGEHTGKNKWEIEAAVGAVEFKNIRRGWDHAIPGGETLKDVHARVVPYYESVIKPQLMAGRNVLVVAHGNSLRALVKHLEQISDTQICDVELATGEVHCYELDTQACVVRKEVRCEPPASPSERSTALPTAQTPAMDRT